MNHLNLHPREAILTWCKEAAPLPWYPSVFAQTSGIPRDHLDPFLDELRLGGLIRLTDWVQGKGQGYMLTPEGAEVALNPRLLAEVGARNVLPLPAPQPLRRPMEDGRPTTWDRAEAIRDSLLHPPRPVVTSTLIFINLAVFLIGCWMAWSRGVPLGKFLWGFVPPQDPDGQEVLRIEHRTGAIVRQDIAVNHEWWRLLSCCFVHIGLLHLAVNMYSLYVIGPLLEAMW